MQKSSTIYIPVLDGIRGISISLVLLGHLTIYDQPNALIYSIGTACGSTGVTLFFVISGYLITTLLVREEDKVGKIDLHQFYIRRVLRIFPAYYTYLTVIVFLAAIGLITEVPSHDYLASIIYVRNLIGRGHETAHLWSLSLEEQFYLIWPSLLVLATARRRFVVVTTLILSICIWRSILVFTSNVSIGSLYMRTDMRFDSILVGCALALLTRTAKFRAFNSAVLSKTPTLLLSLLTMASWPFLARQIPYSATVETLTTALLAGIFINWLISNNASLMTQLLSQSPLLILGKLSYSLYLWQQLFLGPAASPLGMTRRFPLNIVLALAAALTSYWFVEKPFLAIKKRYFDPKLHPEAHLPAISVNRAV